MNSNPKSFNELLSPIIQRLGWKELYLQSQVENDWNELLGENIAKVVKIKKLHNRTLVLKINSSTWRTEMTLRKEWLMNILNSKYGEDTVTEIVIR